MEQDQAICRVCRGESSVSQPLYHPCKCSGSIKYIHQECLIQWLSHSNKKYCELCEYTFMFTPIYRDDMPDRIPIRVIIRQSLSRAFKGLIVLLRATIAITVWLILLPLLTYWTWKFYFWSSKHITGTNQDKVSASLFMLTYNWKDWLSDCVRGQIIMAVVVIVFVAAYLFREWVIQNTTQNTPSDQRGDQQETTEDSDGSANSPTERERMNARLAELRRKLERRRRLNNTDENDDDTEYNDNPYTGIAQSPRAGGFYNMNSRSKAHVDNDFDMDDVNPASGTQSPFISWRDYQQDNKIKVEGGSSLNKPQADSEPSDYFSSGQTEPLIMDEYRSTVEQPESAARTEDSGAPNTTETVGDNENPTTFENNAPANNTNGIDRNAQFDFVEDFDGILEAIGMRGNPLFIIKNSILMALMINLCLCVTVWIPYMIGKSVILIHPPSLFDSLKLESALSYLFHYVAKPSWTTLESTYKAILPESTMATIKTLNNEILSNLYFFFKSIHLALLDQSGSSGHSLAQLVSETTSNIISSSNKIYDWQLIKEYVLSISAVVFSRWRACATGEGSFDRTVCTCIGYIVLISIGSFYLSRHRNTRPGSTNEILHQQAVFIKVLFCIFLELVIFPTVCGFLLDISTFPLFTQWSIKSRFHFFLLNPYTSVFLHWFVGTGFILQYSIFISLVREVVRPGVIYFMRDPNGPQFHPVQDMVDQPTLVLLRKLVVTAGIYFMLIMVGMGLVTLLVSLYGGIYPIIWKFDIPISSLPIDLLAIHFLLAPLMSYIVPREFSKKNVITWWHIVSRQLRLSSFMFGGRYPEEEGHYIHSTWLSWLLGRQRRHNDVDFRRDGRLVRVPAYDNVPLIVPRRRMIIPVDAVTLQPLDDTELRLGHPAVVNHEDQDTTVVYIPPYFKLRIAVFLFLIWMTGSILLCSISVVPLKLGRNLFSKLALNTETPVHDLYSFGLGAFIMILLSTLLNTIIQKYHVVERDEGKINWMHVKNYLVGKIHKVIKFVYLFSMFGFVIPFFIGIMLDLYIFAPLRLSQAAKIELYLMVDWALGAIGFSLFYVLVCFFPNSNKLKQEVVRLNWRNFDQLDIWHTTVHIITPVLLCLFVVIILPYTLVLAITKIFSVHDANSKILIFGYTYPVLFCSALFICLVVLFIRLAQMWVHNIRNDIYLIGRRLNNLNAEDGDL